MVDSAQVTRPTGIKIVCGLLTLKVLFALVLAIGGLAAAPAYSIGMLIRVLLQAAAVYGLWTLKLWGLLLALFFIGLDMLLRIPVLFTGALWPVLYVAVSAIIIVYLISKYSLYNESSISN